MKNGCGDIQGLNSSTSREDLMTIVNQKPCVSAASLGLAFQKGSEFLSQGNKKNVKTYLN